MPRLIFGVLCHSAADFVQAQFGLLNAPGVRFIYHADAKAPPVLLHMLAQLAVMHPSVRVLPPRLCSWAGFSLTAAMLELITAAAALEDWDHLVFLSEQHLPLQSIDFIGASLAPNGNYIQTRLFRETGADGQADVLNRFNQIYQELPGVGAFGTQTATPPDAFLDFLCHGSQWATLCRATCLALTQPENQPHLARFQQSLLSDETALPSWVNALRIEGVTTMSRTLTFAALPGNGGSLSIEFDDRLFFQARDEGYLFIRKRGATLSPAVTAYLDGMFPPALRSSENSLPVAPAVFNQHLAVQSVGGILNEKCRRHGIKFKEVEGGPALQLQAVHPSLKPPFFVFLLSQNLYHFKVLAVHHASLNGFNAGEIGPYRTSVLRVRAPDITFRNEIHLGLAPQNGFCEVKTSSELDDLAHLAVTYVHKVAALCQRF